MLPPVPSTFTHLYDHIIFGTKRRQPLITDDLANDLHPFLGGIARDLGCTAMAIGGIEDHVHLLIRRRPDVCESDLVRNFKSRSSHWANERSRGTLRWQEGYGAFSVSLSSVEEVAAYINNQREYHRELSYVDEFEAFLRKHGIPYDPRELWADE